MSDTTNTGMPGASSTMPEGDKVVVSTDAEVGFTETTVTVDAGDHREHYTLLFCSLSLFLAAVCMPIEGGWKDRAIPLDLYARFSYSGAFLTIFSGYGVLAGWMNIHGRKMIVWPVFFAAADGLYICLSRGLQLVKAAQNSLGEQSMDARSWVHVFGPGWYVIALMSLLVIWTLFRAVMSGAQKDAQRKAEAKAARGKK